MDQYTGPRYIQREHLRDIQQKLMQGSESELRGWTTLSGAKRATEACAFFGIYAIGCTISMLADSFSGSLSMLFLCCGVLLMGIGCNSLGLFLHEGLHGTLSKDKSVNKRWSFLAGMPLLISATAYRVTHTYHHIELGRARDYGTYKQHAQNTKVVWLCYYLQLVLGSIIYIACIPFLGYWQANRKVKKRILFEYALIAVGLLVVMLLASRSTVMQFWLLPMLVMNVLTNIRGLASHALGDTGDPLLASRTISASPLLSWLLLYENYHLAHHLFPKVPSYHLKAVHDHIWGNIPHACWNASYGEFLAQFAQASRSGNLEPVGYVERSQLSAIGTA